MVSPLPLSLCHRGWSGETEEIFDVKVSSKLCHQRTVHSSVTRHKIIARVRSERRDDNAFFSHCMGKGTCMLHALDDFGQQIIRITNCDTDLRP